MAVFLVIYGDSNATLVLQQCARNPSKPGSGASQRKLMQVQVLSSASPIRVMT